MFCVNFISSLRARAVNPRPMSMFICYNPNTLRSEFGGNGGETNLGKPMASRGFEACGRRDFYRFFRRFLNEF